MTKHPNPLKAARGIRSRQGVTMAGVHVASPQETTRKPLIDDLPELVEISFGFDKINAQGEDLFVANEFLPMWYRLGRLDRSLLKQDMFLSKVVVDMLSADVTGTGHGDTGWPGPPAPPILPWGTRYGRGAAIVIGSNIFGSRGSGFGGSEWFCRPCSLPGMMETVTNSVEFDWNQTLNHNPTGRIDQSILSSFGWTIGTLADSQPYRVEKTRSFGLFGKRIGENDNVDICLVLRTGTYFKGGLDTAASILGHCEVKCYLGLTRGTGDFRD